MSLNNDFYEGFVAGSDFSYDAGLFAGKMQAIKLAQRMISELTPSKVNTPNSKQLEWAEVQQKILKQFIERLEHVKNDEVTD